MVAYQKGTIPQSIDETLEMLAAGNYLAGRSLATVLFLSLKMKRPLFLEGEAGVGKTEIAKVLAKSLDRPLIRLQCYEGLDIASAVYEWNYPAQMLEIRLAEAAGTTDRDRIESDIFSDRYLIRRPVLQALAETGRMDAPSIILYLEKGAGFDLLKDRKGTFRPWDHQLLQEMYVVKVKDKTQSKDKWDIFDVVEAVPGAKESLEVIQPTPAENPCRMA